VRIAEQLGVDVDVVFYIKLEDPVTDLVRRDSNFAKLGLTDADVATAEQVIETIGKHKALLQRPVLVTPDKAIIGRPKDRVTELLTPYA